MRWTTLSKTLPWILALGLIGILIRYLDLRALLRILSSSRWELVALAAVLSFVPLTLSRAQRFCALVRGLPCPGEKAEYKTIVALLISARALNIILPARAGDSLNVIQLSRRFGYSAESIVAALAVETLLEAVALGIPALLLYFLGPASTEVSRFLLPMGAIGICCIALALVAWFWKKGRAMALEHPELKHVSHGFLAKAKAALHKLHHSLHLLNDPRFWISTLVWSWIINGIDVVMIGLCLQAVGISLSPIYWFLILATVNIAIVIPTPGNAGTIEAAAVLVLGALNIDRNQAMAFGILYHATHLAPILTMGAVALPIQLRCRSRSAI